MTKVLAGITTSVDGYITGPYEGDPEGEASGEDAAWLDETMSRVGAVVGGRCTYEAAEHWGDENPWELPFFIVTHRPEEQPEGDNFTFVSGVEEPVERALAAERRRMPRLAPTRSHHRARAPGGVGGLAGGLPADAPVPVVEPPRRVRGASAIRLGPP